jgi:hypothetical protein
VRSIEDTLNLIDRVVASLSGSQKIAIALIGGYATIAYGVERTTADIDFCIYTESLHQKSTTVFIEALKKVIPETFDVVFVEGSKILDDSFRHDVIFLHDRAGEYPEIDFIIAKYKWELEGTQSAEPLEDLSFPVLPKPYLIAMKLKAGSLKDDYDISELYSLSNEKEKSKAHELAKLIHRDKKLALLIRPKKAKTEEEDTDLLL